MIMFNVARQLYIFEKGDSPSMKQAIVESISNPMPKYQTSFPAFGQPMEMVVDIKAKVGDESMEFKQLPSGQSVYTYNNVVVTDSKEAMNAELENAMRTSKSVLDSVPMHENAIKCYNKFLMELNPQFAKEKQQEDRISGMEGRMLGIEQSLSSIQGLLDAMVNGNKQS